jgi:hypothetical protein
MNLTLSDVVIDDNLSLASQEMDSNWVSLFYTLPTPKGTISRNFPYFFCPAIKKAHFPLLIFKYFSRVYPMLSDKRL